MSRSFENDHGHSRREHDHIIKTDVEQFLASGGKIEVVGAVKPKRKKYKKPELVNHRMYRQYVADLMGE